MPDTPTATVSPLFPPFPPISPPVRRGRIAQGQPSQLDYLRQILSARVYDIARETELEPARGLSARLGNAVYLKREDNQPVFSFKVRGAYNKMRNTPQAALDRGVITASAGNHAQGVAISAARLGVRATIVVPQTAPQVKVDAVRAHGGPTVEVVLAGDSYSDAYAHAQTLARRQELTFIPAFDDPYVIAGQARWAWRSCARCRRRPTWCSCPLAAAAWRQACPPTSRPSIRRCAWSACRPRIPAPWRNRCARASG